jgi:outer membrane receptor protein involved in Fe transport
MNRSLLLSTVAIALAWPLAVSAQTATTTEEVSDDLLEIVVTAQKREERAFETPLTITAFRGEFLERLGVGKFDDLSRFTPGVTVQEQSPNNPGFVIRGITSDDGSSQIAPRVSIFYNGVDVSRSRGSYFDLFDIERVEAVKGPQATLFGTAASIGAISVITRKPEPGFSAGLTAGIGNFDAWRATGFLNFGDEGLAARFAFSVKRRDGYIENIAGRPGSQTPNGPVIGDLNSQDVLAGRLSIRARPSDRWTIDLVASIDNQEPTGTAFKSGALPPTGGTTSPFSFAEIAGSPQSAAVLGLAGPGLERTVYDLNLTIAYELSDTITLTSVTGRRSFDSLEVFDADGSQAWYLEFAEDAKGDQWSQEFRVNYAGDRVKAFAGFTYFQEDGSQRVPFSSDEGTFLQCAARVVPNVPCVAPNGVVTATQFYGIFQVPPLSGLLPPAARPTFPVPYAGEFGNDGSISTYSIFADVTYSILENLEVTAGLRFVSEQRESGWSSFAPNSALRPLLGLAPAPLLPTFNTNRQRVSAADSNDAILPRFNLRWQATDQINVYATVGKGRRSPVLAVTSATGTQPGPFLPVVNRIPAEEIWNYEGGVKVAGLPGGLSGSLGVFYQTYKNFQVQVSTGTGQIITRNAGTASNFGIEAEVFARPVSWVQLFANGAYIDAKVENKPENGIFANNRFRLQSKWKFAAGFLLDYPVTEDVSLTLLPSITYQSQVFFELPNRPNIAQDGYALANIRGGVSLFDGRYRIEAFATNLFDKDYLIDAGNTGGAFGIPTFIAGPPRFYGIEASVRF